METHIDASDNESIGALFRRMRLERSLEISDIAEETRITPDIIRAMEADDFAALPALAFARGFYGLYAAMLGLNQEEIVTRFVHEYKRGSAAPKSGAIVTPRWQERNIGSMASPPTYSVGTVIGLGLLVILVIAIGISWYAGFNPASQASKWLRGFQTPVAEHNEQVPDRQSQQSGKQQSVVPERREALPPQPPPLQTTAPLEEGYRYMLVAEFQQNTTLTVGVDSDRAETVTLSGGTIKTWQARESIAVTLPEHASVRLFLNGIAVPLPAATDGKISLTIPEYLLE